MAVQLRRGFKAEAEAYAIDFRTELTLRPSAPMDMFRLAQHLEIPAIKLSELRDDMMPANYELLAAPFDSPLSALTMYAGRRRFIVYNDSNAPTRQQSDLGHELAHAILDHPPSALTDASGGATTTKNWKLRLIAFPAYYLCPGLQPFNWPRQARS